MSGPLYVLEDDNGDLFLSCEETCGESTSAVILDDPALWDAYFVACRAMNKARKAVRDALRAPVTPETLTMRQIADVKAWATEKGRKGLRADALRCEAGSDAPAGAMRRICAHINAATTPAQPVKGR